MNEPEPAPVQAHMTTSYRNVCSQCAEWYEEPESGKFCLTCVRKKLGEVEKEAKEAAEGFGEEVEDLTKNLLEVEDNLEEQKKEANELVRERTQLQADVDDLRAQLEKAAQYARNVRVAVERLGTVL